MTWKAIRSSSGGSSRDDGRSFCGIVKGHMTVDNQEDRSSVESGCRYGGGSY